MCQSVEVDIAGLKMLLGELGATKTDLNMQIDSLRDELESVKNNHLEVLSPLLLLIITSLARSKWAWLTRPRQEAPPTCSSADRAPPLTSCRTWRT